jgi:uncharacterized protein involved in exopolysaccharide biosynthesis
MHQTDTADHREYAAQSPTARDLMAMLFRRRRILVFSFFGILLGTILVVIFQPNQYSSEMKILVKRGRLDPVVTPEATTTQPFDSVVTEEELNSEMELVKSRDLLEKVVIACNLEKSNGSLFGRIFHQHPVIHMDAADQANRVAVERAVAKLDKKLDVEVVKKTDLIQINYDSTNPELAAQVLNSVGNFYLDKHVTVHRQNGAFDFFQKASERYGQGLADAEARLMDFENGSAVVSAQNESNLALQKYADFDSSLKQTQAAIAESQKRIGILEAQQSTLPERITTQVRKSDDAFLLSQLQSNLLTLELKRTELLQKYEPTYRPVQELDAQIEQSRQAIAKAEQAPLNEETTDQNPTHEWAREELAKEKADLAGLEARAAATATAAQAYAQKARDLGLKQVTQDDLIRNVKLTEDSYMLYVRKEEESRISDALDRGKILNVVIAEAPTVPALPSNKRGLTLVLGLLLATVTSLGLVFGSEYMDQTFRTPDEVTNVLNIPVLAAMPENGKSKKINVRERYATLGLDR